MRPPFTKTAYKVTTTRDAYGNYVTSGTTALMCHFRYITNVQETSGNQSMQSDAMAWFEPDSGIQVKDLIKYEGEHFTVERITRATRLRSNSVLFLKADLAKYGVIS